MSGTSVESCLARELLVITVNLAVQFEPRQINTDSKISNHRSIDSNPFSATMRMLAKGHKAWIETSNLLAALDRNSREPIPDIVRVRHQRM